MNLNIEAIYENGVLKPSQPIALPEGTRVSLVIETDVETQGMQSAAEILGAIASLPLEGLDDETQDWMESDLEGELPPYEWDEQEMPKGKPVHYTPGVGFVIEGGKSFD